MSEPTNPPYPQQRTPEQHDAVRRRAFPIAVSGAICGVAGLVLLLSRTVGVNHPPNILAVNLSFCALLMGVGILLYAKGTTGTGPAAAAAAIAIFTGLVGPALFAKQSFTWRQESENRELANVAAIATAANRFATEHAGAYPTDLAVLLEQKYITPQTLLSPFAGTAILTEDVAALRAKSKESDVPAAIDAHSDYTYVGGDLNLHLAATTSAATAASMPATAAASVPLAKEIILVYAKFPAMRQSSPSPSPTALLPLHHPRRSRVCSESLQEMPPAPPWVFPNSASPNRSKTPSTPPPNPDRAAKPFFRNVSHATAAGNE